VYQRSLGALLRERKPRQPGAISPLGFAHPPPFGASLRSRDITSPGDSSLQTPYPIATLGLPMLLTRDTAERRSDQSEESRHRVIPLFKSICFQSAGTAHRRSRGAPLRSEESRHRVIPPLKRICFRSIDTAHRRHRGAPLRSEESRHRVIPLFKSICFQSAGTAHRRSRGAPPRSEESRHRVIPPLKSICFRSIDTAHRRCRGAQLR
jgi:hypothetical protein